MAGAGRDKGPAQSGIVTPSWLLVRHQPLGCRQLHVTQHELACAKRELYEETNIQSVKLLAEIPDWLSYDLPPELAGKAWKGKYRGQTQKWFALRFTGRDKEIDVKHPGGGHKPEFVEWRWEPIKNLPDLVVPFKRKTYERVVKEFSKYAE